MYLLSRWEWCIVLAWLEMSLVQSFSPRLAFVLGFAIIMYGRFKFYDDGGKGMHGIDLRSEEEIEARKKELEANK